MRGLVRYIAGRYTRWRDWRRSHFREISSRETDSWCKSLVGNDKHKKESEGEAQHSDSIEVVKAMVQRDCSHPMKEQHSGTKKNVHWLTTISCRTLSFLVRYKERLLIVPLAGQVVWAGDSRSSEWKNFIEGCK